MAEELTTITFEVISARMARLEVIRLASPFGLAFNAKEQIHQLGLREAPLYRLEQPFSPDDRWFVEPNPAGQYIPLEGADDGITQQEFATAYTHWAAGSRAPHGQALLGMLPGGSYWVLRTQREPIAVPRVLLGNELVESTPNILLLREEKPVYACVIGPQLNVAPNLNQPLVGLVILNYVGASWMHGVLFFQCAPPEGADAADNRDLVLILPRQGELVIDNLGFFSAENELESRQKWQDEIVDQFATWCTGASLESDK